MSGLHPSLHGLDQALGGGGSVGPADSVFVELPIVDGATIAVADCVSLAASFGGTNAGRVLRADARFATLAPWFIGVCTVGGTGDAGGTVSATVQIAGIYTDAGAAFTPGLLFLSVTGTGRPVNTVPSGAGNRYVEVGLAVSATAWLIQRGTSMGL